MKESFETSSVDSGVEDAREKESQIEERYTKAFGPEITKAVFELRMQSPDNAIFFPSMVASKLQELSRLPETTLEQFLRFHEFADGRLNRFVSMEENVIVLAENPMKGLKKFLDGLRGIQPDSKEDFDYLDKSYYKLAKFIFRGEMKELRMSGFEQILKNDLVYSIDLADKILKGLPSENISSIDLDKDTKLTASNVEAVLSGAKDGDLESARKLLTAAESYLKAIYKVQVAENSFSSDDIQDAIIAGETQRILELSGLSKEDQDDDRKEEIITVLTTLKMMIKLLSKTNKALENILQKDS